MANAPAPGSVENVLASGTTNHATCVTATGVPTDAAFTSQVLWDGSVIDRRSAIHWESATTDVSRGTARRNTCAALRKPVVARWPVLRFVVLQLAGLAMSGREESTFLLDGAFFCLLRTENVAGSDECCSPTSGKGSTNYCISTPDVMTATMKEPPFERLEICVASEDSREVKHQVMFSQALCGGACDFRCRYWHLVVFDVVELRYKSDNCDDDAPLVCSAPVVDGDTDHAVMAALCTAHLRLHPHVRVFERVRCGQVSRVSLGVKHRKGERIAVVIPLVDVRISNHLRPKAVWHTPSLFHAIRRQLTTRALIWPGQYLRLVHSCGKSGTSFNVAALSLEPLGPSTLLN